MMKRQIWHTTLALFISSSAAYSFDLFEPDRGKPPPPPPPLVSMTKPLPTGPLSNPFVQSHKLPSPHNRPPEVKKPPPPQKDFELRGTSRIGNKRAVVLKGPDNQEFVQYFRTKDKITTPSGHLGVGIKEPYQGYYLLSVEARQIQIEYPTDSPCLKSNEQKGLECNQTDGGKTATLSLKHGDAIPQQPQHSADNSPPQQLTAKKPQDNRRIIKEEDVPPGMRLIRTPFGDRLVPIKE
jgi:hypothetical protein